MRSRLCLLTLDSTLDNKANISRFFFFLRNEQKEESASARSTRKKEERERPRVVKGAKATTATKALATKLPRQMTLPEVDISVSGDVDNAGPSSHPIPAALVGRKPRNRSTSTTTSVTRDDKPSSTTPSLKGKEVGLSNKAAAANYFDQVRPFSPFPILSTFSAWY